MSPHDLARPGDPPAAGSRSGQVTSATTRLEKRPGAPALCERVWCARTPRSWPREDTAGRPAHRAARRLHPAQCVQRGDPSGRRSSFPWFLAGLTLYAGLLTLITRAERRTPSATGPTGSGPPPTAPVPHPHSGPVRPAAVPRSCPSGTRRTLRPACVTPSRRQDSAGPPATCSARRRRASSTPAVSPLGKSPTSSVTPGRRSPWTGTWAAVSPRTAPQPSSKP